VAATWSSHANRATNAPFVVYVDGVALPTVVINQQQVPNDLTDATTSWEYLTDALNISASTVLVKLTDLANGYVIADAIRLERLGDLPSGAKPEKPSEDAEAAPPSARPETSAEPQAQEAEREAEDRSSDEPAGLPLPVVPEAVRGVADAVGPALPKQVADAQPQEESAFQASRIETVDAPRPQASIDKPGSAQESPTTNSLAFAAHDEESDRMAMIAAIVDLTRPSAERALEVATIVPEPDTIVSPLLNSAASEREQAAAPSDPLDLQRAEAAAPEAELSDLQRAGVALVATRHRWRLLRGDLHGYVDAVFALNDWQSP
jgi:hypothetical protein